MKPTPLEVQRLALNESNPQMTAMEEHIVPTMENTNSVTKPGDKAHPIITFEEQRDLVESVLGMNFEGA